MKKIKNQNKITATLTKYKKWLTRKDLSINTINSYLHSISVYGQSKKISTNNLRNYVKVNLNKHQPSTLLTRINGILHYAKFTKTSVQKEKIYKLVPKYQGKLFPTINEEELIKVKKVRYEVNDWVYQRNNLIIDFFTYTGVRVSELVNIKLNDYIGNNQLRVLGKGNKLRYVFIPDFLVKKLYNPHSKQHLFTNYQGKILTRIFIGQIIQNRTKLAKLNKAVSPHTFRRSFATRMNNGGAHLTTIQRLLGHSRIQTTARYIQTDQKTLFTEYHKVFIEPFQEN